MKAPPASLAPSVLIAAELRAGGASWPAVGEQVHRSAEACRKWPREYVEFWDRAFGMAEQRLLGEAGAEALFTLRSLLRAKDDRVRRDAARVLLGARAELRKLGHAPTPAPNDLPAVETLTHAEARTIIDDLGPDARRARGALPVGPVDDHVAL